MIRINLLPVRATQKQERMRAQMLVLAVAVILVLAICGAEYYRMSTHIEEKRQQINAVNREINSLQKKIGEVSRYKKLRIALQQKLDVMKKLREGRSGPVHLLDELNQAIPEKVWLTKYTSRGGSVSMAGVAADEDAVATFMEQLNASPYYAGVELGEITQFVAGGIKLQNFNLSCQATRPTGKK